MAHKTKMISMRVPESILEEIDYIAEARYPKRVGEIKGRNRSQVILEMIEEHLYNYKTSKYDNERY